MPHTGTLPPNTLVRPYSCALPTGSGSDPIGTSSRSHSSPSHSPSRMLNSSVRDALETSVTCSPQSLNTSHESIVPSSARSSTPPSFSSQRYLVPEK